MKLCAHPKGGLGSKKFLTNGVTVLRLLFFLYSLNFEGVVKRTMDNQKLWLIDQTISVPKMEPLVVVGILL